MNPFALCAITALIPLVVGFLWYSPKTFGPAFLKATGLTPESGKTMNMPLVFGLTYLFSFFISFVLSSIVIHQGGLFGLMQPEMNNPDAPGAIDALKAAGAMFEHKFRTFRHGAVHGTITGLFLLTPVIAINAMFERKGWKYILIHGGFWIVCCILIGGTLCQFADFTK